MSHLSRTVLPVAVALGALALPASALAASGSGVVLTANTPRNVVQVVDAKHAVHSYTDAQAGKLQLGSRVRFDLSHGRMTNVVAGKRAPSVTYFAKVTSNDARGLALRLKDGRTLKLSLKQLANAKVLTTDGKEVGAGALRYEIYPRDSVLVTEPVRPGPVTLQLKHPVLTEVMPTLQGLITSISATRITVVPGPPNQTPVTVHITATAAVQDQSSLAVGGAVLVNFQRTETGALLTEYVAGERVETGTVTAMTAQSVAVSTSGISYTYSVSNDALALAGVTVGDSITFTADFSVNSMGVGNAAIRTGDVFRVVGP